MIRHSNMTFTRPLPEDELIKMIESGEITAQDEIAPASGYWFNIQEVEEVKKHFGDQILLKSLIPFKAEITSSTDTLVILEDKAVSGLVMLSRSKLQIAEKIKNEGVQKIEQVTEPSQAIPQLIFGAFLVAIFVGTFLLLWMDSQ